MATKTTPSVELGGPSNIPGTNPSLPSKGLRSWADKVAGSSPSFPRMALTFHEPSVEGSTIVVFPPVEVEELGTKKWELCLVGRFLDAKLPLAVVSSITRKLWLE